MIGKRGENRYIKVCLPLDESQTALCSDQDEPCGNRSEYVQQEKIKNEDYIENIKRNNFFKKNKKLEAQKLLPIKILDNDTEKNIYLNSQNINS